MEFWQHPKETQCVRFYLSGYSLMPWCQGSYTGHMMEGDLSRDVLSPYQGSHSLDDLEKSQPCALFIITWSPLPCFGWDTPSGSNGFDWLLTGSLLESPPGAWPSTQQGCCISRLSLCLLISIIVSGFQALFHSLNVFDSILELLPKYQISRKGSQCGI